MQDEKVEFQSQVCLNQVIENFEGEKLEKEQPRKMVLTTIAIYIHFIHPRISFFNTQNGASFLHLP